MFSPLVDQIIVWVGLALLLLLCLPIAPLQKLLLEVYAWALRLALIALLAGAAYLWFRPEELPPQVTDTLNAFPLLRDILPDPGAPYFATCAASLVVLLFLPLLAALDVSRKLAGRRLRRLRILATDTTIVETPPVPQPSPATVARRVDRRTAADALAQAGPRPLRAPNPLDQ